MFSPYPGQEWQLETFNNTVDFVHGCPERNLLLTSYMHVAADLKHRKKEVGNTSSTLKLKFHLLYTPHKLALYEKKPKHFNFVYVLEVLLIVVTFIVNNHILISIC